MSVVAAVCDCKSQVHQIEDYDLSTRLPRPSGCKIRCAALEQAENRHQSHQVSPASSVLLSHLHP